ncbi:hypothetical protein P3S67_031425 [Capsicum chacoense]
MAARNANGGAGGKFMRWPFSRNGKTTPYDRPLTALRSASWVKKLVLDPATKLISYGAQRFFSFPPTPMLLEHLENLTPKEKSSESRLAAGKDKTPKKLTPNMLRGQALKSLESLDSPKLLQSEQESHKLENWSTIVPTNAHDSSLQKQDKMEQHRQNESINGSTVVAKNNENFSLEVAQNVQQGVEAAESLNKESSTRPAFRMSVLEDSFELDEDINSDESASQLVEGRDKMGVSDAEKKPLSTDEVLNKPAAVFETKATVGISKKRKAMEALDAAVSIRKTKATVGISKKRKVMEALDAAVINVNSTSFQSQGSLFSTGAQSLVIVQTSLAGSDNTRVSQSVPAHFGSPTTLPEVGNSGMTSFSSVGSSSSNTGLVSAAASASNPVGSNCQAPKSPGFGSPFSSATRTVFGFGASSSSFAAPTTTAAVFGSTPSAPSGPAFPFCSTSLTNSSPQPIFGNSNSPFTASPGNNNQMNMEDSMDVDTMNASSPAFAFSQPSVSPSPGGFGFGSTPNQFQFGSHLNQTVAQNVFGSTPSTPSGPAFPFGSTSLTNSSPQPIFGNSNSPFTASPGNKNQMNMEDSMDVDTMNASSPAFTFCQPSVSPSPGGFGFGSTPNQFQFGSQLNQTVAQNPSPFAASGSFGGGGSFSLGINDPDKSVKGNEMQIRGANLYLCEGEELSFYEVLLRARERGEIVIGYRLANTEKAVINPPANTERRKWSVKDVFVVIADKE